VVIHETAIIHPTAKIADNVEIGPWTVIGSNVEIGERTWIGPHVVIQGPTRIGCDNKIFQFSSIGEIPQDTKFKGEETYLEIGHRNVIREFCTFNRGTAQDQSTTRIGHDNLFMSYVHIAHDCEVGNHTIFANNASLAGHVKVEDYVTLGGFSSVVQFCHIGAYSFSAVNSVIIKDIPPFIKVSGYYAKPFGLNMIGLQRRGFAAETIAHLRRAYKIIYRNGFKIAYAIQELQKMVCPEVKRLIHFIETSTSGIIR
jgi:UDP-N-acetylglucosamine acyltransferase